VGDGRQVNVLAYAAWLMSTWHAQSFPAASASGPTGYDARKERERLRAADQSKTGRDIGAQLDELPAVERPDLRAACEADFKLFCTTYFPAAFTLPWSQDHLKVIAKIERAVKEGGLFAHAMPRGSGKTTLTEIACVWAILCGYRPFVCLIGATADPPGCMSRPISRMTIRSRAWNAATAVAGISTWCTRGPTSAASPAGASAATAGDGS
jgi:hypothetical protein